MANAPSEDLFEGTTMSFGEHLEELRICLVRALMGLAIGVGLGLWFADDAVKWIQTPLLKALTDHYSIMAKERLEKQYGEAVSSEMITLAVEYNFTYEEVYLERSQLRRLVGNSDPPHSEAGDAEAGDAEVGDAKVGNGIDSPADANDSLLTSENDEPFDSFSFGGVLAPPTTDMVRTRIWRAAEGKLTSLSPHETFMIWLKAGFVFGLIIASPYIFYQIWLFVAAGLYPHEKKYVYIFLPFSLLLFLSGAAMAFFFVFGPVLNFLFSFSRWMDIDPDLRISEVISFVLILPLGFGLAFQLPLVMLFIHRLGILTVEAYLEKWRIAILVIFVISMVLTPADPVSMLLMAVPLTILYFLGIALCHWMPHSRNPFQEAYDPT